MKKANIVLLSVILLLSFTVLWGCAKSPDVSSTPEQQQAESTPAASSDDAQKAEQERLAAEEARKAAEAEAAKRAEEEAAKERAAREAVEGLQSIHFDFDKSFIRDDAKPALKANAAWLKANPKAKLRVEGNCDERGTIEYNQALGQRRAAAAKKYLTDLGISSSRISLISYGKEKPVCNDSTEECWQKNRRDDLVVVNE